MKSISLNLTTEFLESEAVRNLIITGQQNAILTYISIMTIIRRNGCYVHYDDSLLKEVGRMTGRRAAMWMKIYGIWCSSACSTWKCSNRTKY